MSEYSKTRIDEELMGTLAALSAVELAPDESDSLRADLRETLGYVERLRELEAGTADTHSEAGAVPAAGREDVPTPGLARDEAFRNAPDVQGSFYKAPPIIERQDL